MPISNKYLLILLAFCSAPTWGTPITPFSASSDGAIPEAWQPFTFSADLPATQYSMVEDAELQQPVLQADADSSVSGMVHELEINLTTMPILNFAWKVEQSIAAADLRSEDGDDYAARVYVLFDYPRSRLSWGTRTKLSLAEAIYGVEIPTAALIYIWDNKHELETTVANAYTDRARMIVIDSGDEHAGSWRRHSRDVAADFERAFGEPAPGVNAVIVASDGDNTKSQARAWFADLYFSSE